MDCETGKNCCGNVIYLLKKGNYEVFPKQTSTFFCNSLNRG